MLEYTFDIKSSSGKNQACVDSLSKNPVDLGTEKDEEKALDLPVFSLPGFDLAKAQLSKSNLVPLIKKVKNQSQVETKFCRLAKNFCLKGGVLYKINTMPEVREKLLVIPDKLKAKILRVLFKDVESYIRICVDCQNKK
ncbi:hypothetical protein PR048_014364 [Dryococelus australis]|uniref:Uncharacterized protein n=1 Tax=Dryococelus australis TaxID=614101 RepID=A0ABQ9HE17_9NEOP|nr:hypothetical protein PR048_014364 [Dryococelus australis]